MKCVPDCGSIIQAVTVRVLGPLPLLACTLPPFSKAGEDFINKNKKVLRDDTSCARDENLFSVLFSPIIPIVSAGEKCDSFPNNVNCLI